VPEGVQSALVQEVPGGALLLVLAERPRWGGCGWQGEGERGGGGGTTHNKE